MCIYTNISDTLVEFSTMYDVSDMREIVKLGPELVVFLATINTVIIYDS